jgi:hypothetical protein
VEIVPLGVGRPLRTLEGPIEALCSDPRHEEARHAWVRVILTDDDLPLQAMARLRQRFPHVAELRHRPAERLRATLGERQEQVRQAGSPLDLALAFFSDQQGKDRYTLTWVSPKKTFYLFTNGVALRQMSAAMLAGLFRQGLAELCDGTVPIIDRALDAMGTPAPAVELAA